MIFNKGIHHAYNNYYSIIMKFIHVIDGACSWVELPKQRVESFILLFEKRYHNNIINRISTAGNYFYFINDK